MRLQKSVPTLAAIVALVGAASPAFAAERVSNGSPGGQPAAITQHHSDDSIDWIIGIGAVTGLTVAGTGVAGSRRRVREHGRLPVVPGP
jgi:hypothetical protein